MYWGAGQVPGPSKTRETFVSPGPFEGAMSVDLALELALAVLYLNPGLVE